MQDAAAIERITHELVEDVASTARATSRSVGARRCTLRAGSTCAARSRPSSRCAIGHGGHGRRRPADRGGVRSHLPQMNLAVALEAAKYMADGLTGFDLAGQEAAFPDPLLHRRRIRGGA